MTKHLPQIITSLLDNDLYKATMLQVQLVEMPEAMVEWTYKNRNPDTKFTQEMIDEINYQIDLYCKLRFNEAELAWLKSLRYMKQHTINYLRLYQPIREDITCELNTETMQPEIHFRGPDIQETWHEVPVMSIVAEVYFQMNYTEEEKKNAIEEAKKRYFAKRDRLIAGDYSITFSEFGTRRRFSKEFQDWMLKDLSTWQFKSSTFVGTSNMYFAMKYKLNCTGTMAHQYIEEIGQGYPERNPAYSNKYAMDAWHKVYGTDLGIYLTDCITTDCFLKDFDQMNAILYSGVRHDSGDPVEWGEKILAHYRKLNIDARQKTLLFSDSLDFERAQHLHQYFSGRCKVAFGIGTWLTNDNGLPPMNQVIKLTEVNGIPVCKLSDAKKDPATGLPSKFMGKDMEYAQFLGRSIDWRVKH